MKKAIYPGSFDPITKGHYDIIERASHIFDEIIIAIMEHPSKVAIFDAEKRKFLIDQQISSLPNVRCIIGSGLSTEVAKKENATVLIRGLRSIKDYEYEQEMANANRFLEEKLDTVLFFCDPRYSFISSSLIKEMAHYGKDVSAFVAEDVAAALMEMRE